MSYEFGVDVLGAGPVGTSPLQQLAQLSAAPPVQMASGTTPAAASVFDSAVARARAAANQSDKQSEDDMRTARNIFVGGVLGGAIGSLALGAGGAYLWPAHRILGFFLGSFVGWPMGSTVGGTIGATR